MVNRVFVVAEFGKDIFLSKTVSVLLNIKMCNQELPLETKFYVNRCISDVLLTSKILIQPKDVI